MGMTSYLQKALLDDLLGIAPFSAPAAIYISLHTAVPTDSGSHANEVPTLGSGYARQLITGSMGATDPVSGIAVNSGVIATGVAATDWGTIVALALEDALTGGNMLMWAAPSQVQVISAGQQFRLLANQLLIRFD